MATAKTKQEYVDSWKRHSDELVHVAGEAHMYEVFDRKIRPLLYDMLNEAARHWIK